MRKILLVFSLIALLTFVFPVMASPAPSFNEDDGGSSILRVAHAGPVFDDYFDVARADVLPEQLGHLVESWLRQGQVLQRFVGLVKDLNLSPFNPNS